MVVLGFVVALEMIFYFASIRLSNVTVGVSLEYMAPVWVALLAPVLLIVATLQPLLLGDVRDGVRHMVFAAFGWGYVAWFLGHAVLIQQHIDGGLGIILTLGLAVAFSDVGAFTIGKSFGKHKLAPRLSPNKTLEGVAGNFLSLMKSAIR